MADAISAIGVTYDYEAFCFSGTQSGDELAFDSGNVGIEDDFGFAAEVLYCIEHQFFVVKDRFVSI